MKYSDIKKLLPEVFQFSEAQANEIAPEDNETTPTKDDNLLKAMLEAMEELHTPAEQKLDELHNYFNPYNTKSIDFLVYLSSWLNSDWVADQTRNEKYTLKMDSGRLRNLLTVAAKQKKMKGTKEGLILALKAVIGISDFDDSDIIVENVDKDGHYKPFHIHIQLPPEVLKENSSLIKLVLNALKPAHLTYSFRTYADNCR